MGRRASNLIPGSQPPPSPAVSRELPILGHSQNLVAVHNLIEQVLPSYWKAIAPDAGEAEWVSTIGTRLVVRLDPPADFIGRAVHAPWLAAQQFIGWCRDSGWFPFAWAIETPNEPMSAWDPRLGRYIEFEKFVLDGLRDLGKECIVSNMGTGNDGHEVPGAIYYGAHEYGWPEVLSQAPWHALRYRSWFQAILGKVPEAKLFFTEYGITHAVLSGNPDVGWETGELDPMNYAKSIRDFLSEAATDEYVVAGFLFQIGGNSDWCSFEWPHHINLF